MIAGRNPERSRTWWIWGLAFGLVALYVAVRMGVFGLSAEATSRRGPLVSRIHSPASTTHFTLPERNRLARAGVR